MLTTTDKEIKRLYDRKLNKEFIAPLERDIENKKPSILSDTMFKCMFVNENRIKYSCKFLAYYLNISYEELLKKLRLGKNELDKNKKNSKAERADYVAFINDDIVNIEINCNDSIKTLERNIEYAFRLYSRKIKPGRDYEYTNTIQFDINNFSFEGNKKIVDTYRLQNDEGDVLCDKLTLVQIYVPNIREKCYNYGIDSLNDSEKYLLMLVETSIEESKKLAKGDMIMEDYIEEAIDASNDEWFGEAYDKEWALKDQGFREGIEQDIEQGIEQGIKKTQHQLIKRLLEKKYSLEEISEISGLSINKIRKLNIN